MIVGIHEFGHFITAKKSGIQVNEFALGMGPKIFGFKKGETQYSLRLIPIGGYCAMEGEDEDSENPRSFEKAKVWKRMIVVIAGAVMNILLGFILMFVVVVQQSTYSSTTIDSFPELSYSQNSGLQAGDKLLKINGTSIVSSRDISFALATTKPVEVDGTELTVYQEDCLVNLFSFLGTTLSERNEAIKNGETDYMSDQDAQAMYSEYLQIVENVNSAETMEEAQSAYEDGYKSLYAYVSDEEAQVPQIEVKESRTRFRVDILVERAGRQVLLEDVDFYTYLNSETQQPMVAVDFYTVPVERTFLTAVSESFKQTVSIGKMVWDSLVGIVTGRFGLSELSGPIGAASAISQVTSQSLASSGFIDGLNTLIFMMALITVNLGIFNMLPFPALDGGRFVMLIIEAIRKKPVSMKIQNAINASGFIILIGFMLIISMKDIWQIIGG